MFCSSDGQRFRLSGPPVTASTTALPGYMLHVLLAGGKTDGEMFVDLSEGGERQMLVAFKQTRPATQPAEGR